MNLPGVLGDALRSRAAAGIVSFAGEAGRDGGVNHGGRRRAGGLCRRDSLPRGCAYCLGNKVIEGAETRSFFCAGGDAGAGVAMARNLP